MKVDTRRLNEQALRLRVVERQLLDIQECIYQVAKNLGEESFGEKFQIPLQRTAESVSKRCMDVGKLRSALTQITALYTGKEQQIVDEANRATVHHPRGTVETIRLLDDYVNDDGGAVLFDWTPWDV